jgi:nitrogen fixation/metabolism regulation signal transduction histidine kinase
MEFQAVKRFASSAIIGVGGALWLAAILFMAQTAQNSEQFGRLHPWILMINVAGLIVLLALLATKLTQLVRDWRGHVIGSRLKARMVWIFGVLATLPILLVYFFAVQFLNRGIDSWFNVEIRRSLDDALVLSRSALEVRMREQLAATDTIADEVQSAGGPAPGCSNRCDSRRARSSSRLPQSRARWSRSAGPVRGPRARGAA